MAVVVERHVVLVVAAARRRNLRAVDQRRQHRLVLPVVLARGAQRRHALARVHALQQWQHHVVHGVGVVVVHQHIPARAHALVDHQLAQHVMSRQERARLPVHPPLDGVAGVRRVNAVLLHALQVLRDVVHPQVAAVRPDHHRLCLRQHVVVGDDLPGVAAADGVVLQTHPLREVGEVELAVVQFRGRVESCVDRVDEGQGGCEKGQTASVQSEINKHHADIAIRIDCG